MSWTVDRMTERRLRKLEAEAGTGQRVFTVRELRAAGVTRAEQRQHVDAERWRAVPRRAVVVDRGPLDPVNAWRAALAEVSSAACLGGVSALQAAGLVGLTDREIHVWVRKSTRKGRPSLARDVVLHESRRWDATDAIDDVGVPRARPEVAAVQAALWSTTLRQASLMLVMPVQQRLVTADRLVEQLERIRRHRFRSTLGQVLADVRDGSHSMNELDFVTMCRRFGIPEPSRQVARRGPGGTIHVDCRWERYGVSLEIQGAGHGNLLNSVGDDLRLLGLATDGDVALSVSVLTLRIDPSAYFAALATLFRSRGWEGHVLRPAS